MHTHTDSQTRTHTSTVRHTQAHTHSNTHKHNSNGSKLFFTHFLDYTKLFFTRHFHDVFLTVETKLIFAAKILCCSSKKNRRFVVTVSFYVSQVEFLRTCSPLQPPPPLLCLYRRQGYILPVCTWMTSQKIWLIQSQLSLSEPSCLVLPIQTN